LRRCFLAAAGGGSPGVLALRAKTRKPNIRRDADVRNAKAGGMPAVSNARVFAEQKLKSPKTAGCRFWAAQGIEAEFPGPSGAGELERIARFFAAPPQKMRPKEIRRGLLPVYTLRIAAPGSGFLFFSQFLCRIEAGWCRGVYKKPV
jgi:hypothetical protein